MRRRRRVPVEVVERQLRLPFLPEEVYEQRGVDSHALVRALVREGRGGGGINRGGGAKKEKKAVSEKSMV